MNIKKPQLTFQPLVKHLVENNLAEIASKSFLNYGVEGLHCISLFKETHKSIKLFYCDSNHSMYGNFKPDSSMQFGFQQCDCNTTIQCVMNKIYHWRVNEITDSKQILDTNIGKYVMKMSNTEKVLHYDRQFNTYVRTVEQNSFTLNKSTAMFKGDIYTIGVPLGKEAAWLQFESNKSADGRNYHYTNNVKKMKEFNPFNYYQLPNEMWIYETIRKIGLLS